jgi:hypothetical protein
MKQRAPVMNTEGGSCVVPGCTLALDHMGEYCNLHGHMSRYSGSAEHRNLTARERAPYIKAAHQILSDGSVGTSLGSDMDQLLESCRPFLCRQADVLRMGFTTREKAKSILAQIYKQRGDQASLLILSAAIGTASMTMKTSAPRYAHVQQARAVFHLLKSEKQEVFGVVTSHRIVLQGYRLAVALYDLIQETVWPMVEGLRKQILEVVKLGRQGACPKRQG